MVRESSEIATGTQPQVFVSYARSDAEQVLNIARLLEQAGATIWRDGDRIIGGQYYGEEIVHAIAHSRVVMLMCSPQSFRSDNVHREVLLTWEYYHRCYIPVWLGPATEIPERFRYCLVGCQWIDAHSQPPEQWLPQLLKALEALGVETKRPAGQPGKSTPKPAAETDRRGLRFQPGDRPIRGADWELEQLLGKGGFAEVWKAHNPDLPDLPAVALKFCLELDDRSKDLLRHEANMVLRAQQQIRSDGIVPLLHAYLNNDPPCLEYPYIGGGTLVRLLDECRQSAGSFTPAQVQRIIERLAQIISPAHRATPKLVHRDLKPSNVLVERRADGKLLLRVTDFGIGAVAAQPVLDRSRSSSSMQGNLSSVLTGAYSPLYASPQQMHGQKPDPRDDVYAFGVIWYQLLTGDLTRPAPTGRRWIDALRRHGMDDAAIDLLSSCFESDPADRPVDAGMLAEQLQALSPSSSTETAAPTPEWLPVEPVPDTALESFFPPAKTDLEPALPPSPKPFSPSPEPGTTPPSPASTAVAADVPAPPSTAPSNQLDARQFPYQGSPWPQSASPAPSALREAVAGPAPPAPLADATLTPPRPQPLVGWNKGTKRWAAAGATGLLGLLGVILYVNQNTEEGPPAIPWRAPEVKKPDLSSSSPLRKTDLPREGMKHAPAAKDAYDSAPLTKGDFPREDMKDAPAAKSAYDPAPLTKGGPAREQPKMAPAVKAAYDSAPLTKGGPPREQPKAATAPGDDVPPPPVPGPAPDEKIAAPRPAPPRRTGPLPSTPTVLAPGSSSRPTEEQAIAAITRALGAHKNIDSMIMSRTNGSVSWLNLSNLDATDADLANIRAFGNLKYLFLIGGKITDTGLAYLAEVPTLEGLYISQNKVTGVGLQALRNLPRLSRLDFSPQAGFKAEYLEPIASCKELENVTIESYKLSADALRPLRQLPRLRDLGLKGSGVTDAEMSLIAEFTNLEELDLQGCPVTGKGLQQLRNLNKLTKLNVSYNHSLHDEDLKELKGCRSLGRINIGETHISDAGLLYLVPLPKLREVAVGKSGSKANEKSLLEKGERPQETNRITDKGRAAFKKERPDVEIVE